MRNTYRYYLCQSRANQSLCQYHSWRASELEQVVIAKLRMTVGKKIDSGDRLESDAFRPDARRTVVTNKASTAEPDGYEVGHAEVGTHATDVDG